MLYRGRLWYIKETSYSLFCTETRYCLKTLSSQHEKYKQEIIRHITSSDDVFFHWINATADFEIDYDEVHEMLLEKMVELCVTMRGFSYASGWMEKFKKITKQSTQQSKSLRREQ